MTEDLSNRILILLGVALLMVFLASVRLDASPPQGNGTLGRIGEIQIIEGSYLLAQAPSYLYKGQTYTSLIDCLIYHESKGNPQAVGKYGEIGILQFKPQTFQEFCVKRYGYQNYIWSPEIQKSCCAEMIEEGFLNHWTTAKYCYE